MDRSYDEKEGPTLLQLLRSPRLYVSVSVIEQAGWRERESGNLIANVWVGSVRF